MILQESQSFAIEHEYILSSYSVLAESPSISLYSSLPTIASFLICLSSLPGLRPQEPGPYLSSSMLCLVSRQEHSKDSINIDTLPLQNDQVHKIAVMLKKGSDCDATWCTVGPQQIPPE